LCSFYEKEKIILNITTECLVNCDKTKRDKKKEQIENIEYIFIINHAVFKKTQFYM